VVEEIIGRLPYLTEAQIGRLEDEIRRSSRSHNSLDISISMPESYLL